VKKIILVAIALGVVFFRSSPQAWGEEVPFTLEDRDRLIRIETSLKEFKESVDRRFEQVMTFMWILSSVFGGLVAVTIGFAIWDRRTALTPALRRSGELEEREEKVERVLRELAQKDPNVAEALRHAGFL
jgi:hypothetical protein